ncbi:MAG: TlpA family protein disulfide reductase [Bacteroidia bacterium]|nr:TlpA family protein disulfide reductase [Bacteroidia bacterium]
MKNFAKYILPISFFVVVSGNIPEVKIDALNTRLKNGGDTIYVVNFWATWCGPCVAELPYFEKLDSVYKDKKVKVILVSTDFRKDIDTRLKPFVEKRKLHSEVDFLDEIYDNEWIPKVDSAWQGNIPATKIYNAKTGKTVFLPRQTTYAELDSLIKDVQ